MFLTIWIIILTLAVIWLNIAFIVILNNNNKAIEGRLLKLLINKNLIKLDGTWESSFPPNVINLVKMQTITSVTTSVPSLPTSTVQNNPQTMTVPPIST
jgi:hypothetical protein